MTGPGDKAQERRSVSSATGGADTPRYARSGASGAKHPNASPMVDKRGRFLHPCQHPGCGRNGVFGQGADLRRYYRAVEKGEVNAERWLGRWWCREHVPDGVLPQPDAPRADPAPERREAKPEAPRRQVINGQEVLL